MGCNGLLGRLVMPLGPGHIRGSPRCWGGVWGDGVGDMASLGQMWVKQRDPAGVSAHCSPGGSSRAGGKANPAGRAGRGAQGRGPAECQCGHSPVSVGHGGSSTSTCTSRVCVCGRAGGIGERCCWGISGWQPPSGSTGQHQTVPTGSAGSPSARAGHSRDGQSCLCSAAPSCPLQDGGRDGDTVPSPWSQPAALPRRCSGGRAGTISS